MRRHITKLMLPMLLSGCAVWPSGDDPKGKEYRIQANALVDSIIQYKINNIEMPPSLSTLVPEYIEELPDVANHTIHLEDKGSLIYDYTPTWPQQGRTSCFTVIGSGRWECGGYI